MLVVGEVLAFEGAFGDVLRFDDLVRAVAAFAQQHGAVAVHGDQRESYALESAMWKHGLRYFAHPWTAENKTSAVTRLRRLLAERSIILPADDKLRRELAAFSERILPSGAITFGARNSGHDDRLALAITAAIIDAAGYLGMSPLARPTAEVRASIIAPALTEPAHAVATARIFPSTLGVHERRSGRRHIF